MRRVSSPNPLKNVAPLDRIEAERRGNLRKDRTGALGRAFQHIDATKASCDALESWR